jgi:inner membrane transporter RhtA
VGAVVVLPVGVVQAGSLLLNIAALPLALVVAVLSSALPYSLEMWAMTRMPTRSFGIFMSVEPAFAALVGLAVLGEQLGGLQWLAVGCVMLASLGSALTATRQPGGELDDAYAGKRAA